MRGDLGCCVSLEAKQHFEIEGQTNFNATPFARKLYFCCLLTRKIKLPQTLRSKLLTGEKRLLTEDTSLERVDHIEVEFELRDEVPGISDEHEGWTPVVKRRRKNASFPSASDSLYQSFSCPHC